MERIFRIRRFDPDAERKPYFKEYKLECPKGMTVLEALFEILEKQDPTLSFRYNCRAAVCGSCGMEINGKHRLACATQVSELTGAIIIEPLPGLRVIKDLVVDMDEFFNKYKIVKPYLIRKSPFPEKEIYQSPEDWKKMDPYIYCIMCACCTSSCPVTWSRSSYLTPAVFVKAWRFVADSRDEGKEERLTAVNSEDGVWRCHTAFRCVEACPKDINPTSAIVKLRNAIIFGKKG